MASTHRKGFWTGVSALSLGATALLMGELCLAATPAPAPARTVAGVVAPPSSTDPNPPGYARGYTKPSDQADLAFATPGVVKRVPVKAGDTVEKDKTVIAVQDDAEELAKLAVAEGEILNADYQIRAADADLAKKRVDLRRVEDVNAKIIAEGKTNSEVDEARVNVKIAEIAYDYRKQDKKQKELERDLQKVRVEQKRILSPINGVVAKIELHAGEGTDIQRPAGIQLVQNDPLWVEAQVPTAKAAGLQKGQTLKVFYPDSPKPLDAKVIFLAPVANAGANVRLVRLELPNPTNREAGLPMLVSVPENQGAGQAAQAK